MFYIRNLEETWKLLETISFNWESQIQGHYTVVESVVVCPSLHTSPILPWLVRGAISKFFHGLTPLSEEKSSAPCKGANTVTLHWRFRLYRSGYLDLKLPQLFVILDLFQDPYYLSEYTEIIKHFHNYVYR